MVYIPGRKGTLAAEMTAATRRLGRMPYLLDGTLSSLITEVAGNRPVAVLLNLGPSFLPRWHFAVVTGYDGPRGKVLLRSGTQKEAAMPAGRFMRSWKSSGYWAMVVLRSGEVPETVRKLPYFQQASALETAGMTKGAEAAWRRAALLWPEDPTPALGLGNAFAAQGRLAEAEEEFRKTLTLDPDSVVGMNNLSHVLSLQGCHDEALLLVTEAFRRASGTSYEGTVAATREEILERRGERGYCPR